MSFFRSAAMKYYELYIPKEQAYGVASKLAPFSFVQFLDAAESNFHKPYYNSIRRCQESITKIDSIMKEVRKRHLALPDVPIVEDIFKKHEESIKGGELTDLSIIDAIETDVTKSFAGLDESIRSLTNSEIKITDLEDYKYLLFKGRQVFGGKKQEGTEQKGQAEAVFNQKTMDELTLTNVSGVIQAKDMLKFTKMIFRATKENSIIYTFNIPNDSLKFQAHTAFIIIIESGFNVVNKVNRICDSFGAKKYPMPTTKDQIFSKIKNIEEAINDTKQLVIMTQKQLSDGLNQVISTDYYGYAKYESYRVILERETIIYHTLNLLEERYNSMIAYIWVPEAKRGLLFTLLPSTVTVKEPRTKKKPPTYFQMNEFTAPFQQIIDTYGIPRYEQINPALFAIPIFPFLFGVMFGDMGHGGVLLCFAIWLLYSKDSKIMLPDIYSMRYLLLLMGIFAFYSGFIYNQFFSLPINLFGSCYGHADPEQYADKQFGCVYPFGFDPKWFRASNDLNFFNSYKMKFAVIIGVLQMTMAIMLKMLNTLHFKNYLDFIFEWLPQQVFFFCTFGYMCILIVFKWSIPWGEGADTAQAPSIIAQMIALPLKLGSTEGKPLWDMQSQQDLQYLLLMTSLVCVPWMLVFKPFILWCKMPSKHQPTKSKIGGKKQLNSSKKQLRVQDQLVEELNPVAEKPKQHKKQQKGEHQQEDISQIAVHQIIETIQFVLGSISNTASYLRLWALSLAHGQLSKVFLQKTIGGGIESGDAIIIMIGMYFFFNITIGVIMGMDTMECFLHALRLQWVQFDSKFFKADGRKFTPLSITAPIQAKIIKMRAEE